MDLCNTAGTSRGFAQYNRLFTERVFGYLRLDGLHDAIADIEYRFTFSPGVGYYFIKNAQTTLSGEAGSVFHRPVAGSNAPLALQSSITAW